jgi:lipopolysaccharide transport system ATP-binding protein
LDPEILIIDEVLAVGDAEFQRKCLGKMQDVSRGGRTVLFVSHNLPAVQSLCGRCIWIEGGKLASDGPTAETTHKYQAAFYRAASACGGDFLLTDRTNTYAAGDVLVQRVVLRTLDDHVTNVVAMGGSLSVDIHVGGLLAYPGAVVGLRVTSDTGELLADFNTAMRPPRRLGERKGAREIYRLRIPRLPLVQGQYSFGVAVGDSALGILDFVPRVGPLFVADADVYGTGTRIPPHHAVVLLDGEWDVSADPE